jgi:hypothetical protein
VYPYARSARNNGFFKVIMVMPELQPGEINSFLFFRHKIGNGRYSGFKAGIPCFVCGDLQAIVLRFFANFPQDIAPG